MPRLGSTTPLIEFASDHVKWPRGILELISRLLVRPLGAIIVIGFLAHLTQVCLFAALFMACGEDCFDELGTTDDDGNLTGLPFDFEQMFALSVHTFTTVGYGSVYPTCPKGQLLVLVEEYTALIAQLVLGALILLKVMTPHASVRFATSVLISPCQTSSGWQLHVRLVNQSRYALVHGKAQMRMLFQDATGSYSHLKASLVADAKALMLPGEPWTLRHVFDASSPIEVAMGADRDGDGSISDVELHQMLEKVFAIDVSLSFVDPVYGPKVRFSRRFFLRDVVTHAQWDDMLRKQVLSERADGSEEHIRLVYDHDLLDSYTEMPLPHAIHHHHRAAVDAEPHSQCGTAASCHYREPPQQDSVTHAATKVASAAATCAAI